MTLRTAIDRYIDWQRTLGSVYRSQAFELRRFCRSVGDGAACQAVTDEHARAFIDGGDRAARSRRRRYYVLASFYRFAISRGLVTCSPLPPTAPQQNPPKPPHIYTREELSRLLEATESSQARARQLAAHTLRALLVLLYGAGLRRGEALRLTIADVNLTDRLLLVRETKFHKTRLVPLAPQLARAMERYASRRKLDGASQSSDAPFFANRDGTPLSPGTVSGAFTRLRRAAGVVGAPGERQPNLHGLRHSFCVERLSSWYRQGEDVQRLLPLLSTYLGHSSIAGTQVYLDTIPNLLREASSRFEHYARGATGGTHA